MSITDGARKWDCCFKNNPENIKNTYILHLSPSEASNWVIAPSLVCFGQ